MSQIKRIQLLEKHFSTDVDHGPEAVIIFSENASLEDTEPMPVTKFTCQGQEIHREPDERYQSFETRAIREALENLPKRKPGAAAPTPVLIADGSLQI